MRTFLSFSGGRLAVRTKAHFQCVDCGHEYHPRVHDYPGVVIALGVIAVLPILAVFGLWLAGRAERLWLLWAKVAAAIVVAIIGVMASRLHTRLLDPRIHSRDTGRESRYGEIVLECPRCGSRGLG